jgi:hypothetical protein
MSVRAWQAEHGRSHRLDNVHMLLAANVTIFSANEASMIFSVQLRQSCADGILLLDAYALLDGTRWGTRRVSMFPLFGLSLRFCSAAHCRAAIFLPRQALRLHTHVGVPRKHGPRDLPGDAHDHLRYATITMNHEHRF